MDFNTVLDKYVKYDKYIQEQDEKLKEYRDKRAHYYKLIVNYMKKKNITQQNLDSYEFKLNKTIIRGGFTQKYLKSTIEDYFDNKININLSEHQKKLLSQKLLDYVINSRPNEPKYVLKY